MGAVRRYWSHGLPLTVVVIVATGSLPVGLLLFLDFLPLLPVDKVPVADLLVGTGLVHVS